MNGGAQKFLSSFCSSFLGGCASPFAVFTPILFVRPVTCIKTDAKKDIRRA